MAIRYIEQDRTFWLDTEHTSYIMAVVDEENFVGHVYYGQKLQYGKMEKHCSGYELFVNAVRNRSGYCISIR